MGNTSARTCIVRQLHPSMIDDYMRAFSPTIQTLVHARSVDEERAYVVDRLRAGAPYFFGIFERVHDQLIGAIEIRNPDVYAGQLYCWLNEQFWSTGIFQDALHAVMQIYFLEQPRGYITAHVDGNNARSYHALKNAGCADYGIGLGSHGLQYILIMRNHFLNKKR